MGRKRVSNDNPYLEILRLPGALAFSAAGFLARTPMSMFGLGTVLLIAAVTGRYGLAGLVAAAGSVSYALGAPQFARLADRFGQGRVLRPQVIAGYGLIERQAPPERRTEGMTWLSSAISVGVAAGSPLAGHLIDAYGARWGYLLAAACGCAAVLTGVAGRGRLGRPGGWAGHDHAAEGGGTAGDGEGDGGAARPGGAHWDKVPTCPESPGELPATRQEPAIGERGKACSGHG